LFGFFCFEPSSENCGHFQVQSALLGNSPFSLTRAIPPMRLLVGDRSEEPPERTALPFFLNDLSPFDEPIELEFFEQCPLAPFPTRIYSTFSPLPLLVLASIFVFRFLLTARNGTLDAEPPSLQVETPLPPLNPAVHHVN